LAVSIRFGEFTFDPERRELARANPASHLSPKAFELLRTLVDCRPRAASKTELLERVWRGTFISEASLTMVVAEIVHPKAFFSVWHPELVALRESLGLSRHPAQVVVSKRG
jgi:hypothetical protein